MPKVVKQKAPAEHVGLFVENRWVRWYQVPKKTTFLIERYDPRLREFEAFCYLDGERYAIPLLDFNRHFYVLNPQPILETAASVDVG
jgi:hypothetical protein